ncbi:MAG: hypothetical protein K0S26_1003 [Bacteroidota bacterium]|jgi:hypothetical protein|nr:hypothetical protein [Bacteroidota bacterium]
MKTPIHIHFLILLTIISSFAKSINPVIENKSLKSADISIKNTEPSELLSFEAVQKADKVELFWDIKSKSQHDFFTVERSKNGINFEKIATIDAGGNSNNMIQYIETDHRPLKGKSYYRLKLTDNKNKSTYSNVIVVNSASDKKSASASKPGNKIDLKKLGNKPVLVVLRDAGGKEHYSKVEVKTEESNIIGTDQENRLTPGTYTIKATSHNALYSHKLIVR